MEFNIYCDETCHLENDKSKSMAIGSIRCQKEYIREINREIKLIKEKNNFNINSEAKWTKICKKHLQLYMDLVNLFFDNKHLFFRCLVIQDKSKLKHENYNQSHEDWYYKMYFTMLKQIFDPEHYYNVYIDIKDTHSYEKACSLNDVCCNNLYDFSHDIVKKIQPIRSDEVEIMQLVDILIGGICYLNRYQGLSTLRSPSKQKIIELIQSRSKYKLTQTTLLREDKFNLFMWKPDYVTGEIYHAK